MVACPSATPVTLPPLTLAILLSEEDHFTVRFLLLYFSTEMVSLCLAGSSIFGLLTEGAFTTFTLQVYFLPPFFHVMVAFPVFLAVITPVFVTDATVFFEDEYFPVFSSAPSTSRSSLSPFEITHVDSDSFAAACAGATGTAVTASMTAMADAIALRKCLFIALPPC